MSRIGGSVVFGIVVGKQYLRKGLLNTKRELQKIDGNYEIKTEPARVEIVDVYADDIQKKIDAYTKMIEAEPEMEEMLSAKLEILKQSPKTQKPVNKPGLTSKVPVSEEAKQLEDRIAKLDTICAWIDATKPEFTENVVSIHIDESDFLNLYERATRA